MTSEITIAAVVAVIAIAAFLIWRTAGRTWLRYRGTRVVNCTETQRPAAVDVDLPRAMGAALKGRKDVRLEACTGWPEREGCAQECVSQVEVSPRDTMLVTILTRWYETRSCAFCGEPFGKIHWHDHRPCLLTPEGVTKEWLAIQAEDVRSVLSSHRPVCWNCHIAERFRRQHPDLVLDRDRTRPARRS